MTKPITKPISTRITLEEFAKVRDCLIERGVSSDKLMSNSNIVRAALFIIIAKSANPTGPASQESLNIIRQLWRIDKQSKKIDLNDLY